MLHIQNSLFPDNKGAFDANSFVTEQLNDNFRDWITDSILSAFSNTQKMSEIQEMTLRAKSDVLHDGAFAQIKQNVGRLNGDAVPFFYSDFSGNRKQYFEYNGYLYILRKSGVGMNGTKIDAAIVNQELPMHVITIEYNVSPLWDAISTISFKYIKGDGLELDFTVPMNLSMPSVIDGAKPINTEETISTYIPKLKKDALQKKAF